MWCCGSSDDVVKANARDGKASATKPSSDSNGESKANAAAPKRSRPLSDFSTPAAVAPSTGTAASATATAESAPKQPARSPSPAAKLAVGQTLQLPAAERKDKLPPLASFARGAPAGSAESAAVLAAALDSVTPRSDRSPPASTGVSPRSTTSEDEALPSAKGEAVATTTAAPAATTDKPVSPQVGSPIAGSKRLHARRLSVQTITHDAALMALLPPPDHHDHFFRLNFLTHLSQNSWMVTCDFVAQLGRSVHLVDIRNAHDIVGPLGYVAGVDWVPHEMLETQLKTLTSDEIVVLISSDDHEAQAAAKHCQENLSMRWVCAMRGGMRNWRFMGFTTIRDPAILKRQGKIRDDKKRARRPSTVAVDEKTLRRECGCPGDARTICLAELETHIGDPLNIQWLKMAAFLVHGKQSCVDGRDDSGVIGTPGGDMGEFVLAMTVAEQLCDTRFTFEQVDTLLRRRLDAFGRFYMHTDTTTIDKLKAKMTADPRLASTFAPIVGNPLLYRKFMRSPPQEFREAIMEHQLNPAHIGCGHLRLLLTKSSLYKVRPKLVLHTLRAFFTARWNGAIECEYMALPGEHSEGGVINVHLATRVAPFTRIPLISPSCNGRQLFVHHPQITSYLRRQTSMWFTMQDDIVRMSDGAKTEFYPKVEALASLHLGTTLGFLAEGLPIYSAKFEDVHGQHHFSVNQLRDLAQLDADDEKQQQQSQQKQQSQQQSAQSSNASTTAGASANVNSGATAGTSLTLQLPGQIAAH